MTEPSKTVSAISGTLLSYVDDLQDESKSRYLEKIATIGGIDPFHTSAFGEQSDDPPHVVDAYDLFSHLVLHTSFILAEQFKAQKGL